MTTYLVTEHGAALCDWYYTVEADSKEEAEALVRAGDVDPFDSSTGDSLEQEDTAFTVEEANPRERE